MIEGVSRKMPVKERRLERKKKFDKTHSEGKRRNKGEHGKIFVMGESERKREMLKVYVSRYLHNERVITREMEII